MEKFKDSISFIVIIILIILLRVYVVTLVRVDGDSMNQNFNNGDILVLSKLGNKYDRFDVVVFGFGNERLIKRVIGLPSERICYKDNILYINDVKLDDPYSYGSTNDFDCINIKNNQYFVMGDNRNNSLDSRIIGAINTSRIDGKIVFRLFPLNKIGTI